MSDDIAIKVENLSKIYLLRRPHTDVNGNSVNEYTALNNVSFEINKGESIGIIGSNGSGKSTLLKILAGVTAPTSGKVTIKGKVASILDIGAGFHPELSGRENVFLNGQIHGFSKKEIQERFDEIVDFSGIKQFIDEPVKNYSNGMYLRLAFSIVVHMSFDVYLFDEVLGVGDDSFRVKVTEFFHQKLLNRNATVVLVSHNFHEIVNFSEKCFLINSGKLESEGLPSDMIHRLKHYSFQQKANSLTNSNAYFKSINLSFLVDNIAVTTASIEDSISVRINLVRQSDEQVKIAIRVRDFLGNVVFVTSYPNQLHEEVVKCDIVNLTAVIPKFYFNKGTFTFDIVGISADDKILFSIVNAGEIDINSGSFKNDYWLNNSFGPVRPFLDWKIEEL
jgi:lipopolysaccharide transport system ATP-binding protein